jgi:hypothetical protein
MPESINKGNKIRLGIHIIHVHCALFTLNFYSNFGYLVPVTTYVSVKKA